MPKKAAQASSPLRSPTRLLSLCALFASLGCPTRRVSRAWRRPSHRHYGIYILSPEITELDVCPAHHSPLHLPLPALHSEMPSNPGLRAGDVPDVVLSAHSNSSYITYISESAGLPAIGRLNIVRHGDHHAPQDRFLATGRLASCSARTGHQDAYTTSTRHLTPGLLDWPARDARCDRRV